MAGFLALNFGILFLSITGHWGLQWPWFASWVHHLNFDIDNSHANGYSVIVWCLAAILAFGHVWTKPRGRYWRTGWICCALIAGAVAAGEFNDRRLDLGSGTIFSAVNANYRFWLIVGPIALPLLLGSGWVIWLKIRSSTTLRVLGGCFVLFGLIAIARDAFQGRYESIYDYQDEFYHWIVTIEDGYELIMSAIVVVILASPAHGLGRSALSPIRSFQVSAGIVLGCSVALLFPTYLVADPGWRADHPQSYTGPITVVEQVIRVERAWLSELEVWAFVEGGAEAKLFARITSAGGGSPIRESSAEVSHKRWSNGTVRFRFVPIPDSDGQDYDIAIGSLSGPTPWVFLGLAGGDPNSYSSVRISGMPTTYENDLALRSYWKGRGISVFLDAVKSNPMLLGLAADVVVSFALWLWVVMLVPWRWRGEAAAIRGGGGAAAAQSTLPAR